MLCTVLTNEEMPFNLISEHAHFGLLSEDASYKVQIRVRNDGLDASRFKARFASSEISTRTLCVKRCDSGHVVADLSLEYEPVKVAPGMKAVVNVILHGKSVGRVADSVIIDSMTGTRTIVQLTATILTLQQFDKNSLLCRQEAKPIFQAGVTQISGVKPVPQRLVLHPDGLEASVLQTVKLAEIRYKRTPISAADKESCEPRSVESIVDDDDLFVECSRLCGHLREVGIFVREINLQEIIGVPYVERCEWDFERKELVFEEA